MRAMIMKYGIEVIALAGIIRYRVFLLFQSVICIFMQLPITELKLCHVDII